MSSKFTCRFCKEQFDIPKGLYKHLQTAHNAGASRDNRTCPICGVLCSKYEGYRDHLLYIHGQTSEGQKLSFKSLNEFLVWKAELELKHNCKYVLQSSPKVLPNRDKKYFYQCDRSNSKSKDKKNMSVVMKTCTSVISVLEGTGVFTVEYWDTHSGHSAVPSRHCIENELEAAITSVEMVNAIGDSDDSIDKSDDVLVSGHSSPNFSGSEKQSFFIKTNSPSNVNNFNNQSSVKKTSIVQSSVKIDGSKKKSTNTSILFSLASVACGKGITKKPKTNENKDIDSSKTKAVSNEKANESSLSVSDLRKRDSVPNSSVSEASVRQESSVKPPATILSTSPKALSTSTKTLSTSTATLSTSAATLSTSATTLSTSAPTVAKVATSGLQAIAPKISSVSNNAINSLITTNSAFQNQLVIVNPVGMDQNAKQNVFTAGQNILFSLGSLGQNIIPTNSTAVSINPVSVVGDKNAVPAINTKVTKTDTSVKINTTPVSAASPKISSTVSQNVTKSSTSAITSTASSTVPITLNNAPVILSSLPVGSTFMSVNNSLIPIATPSGTFLPTSLPPNIVLTPVLPGTTLPNLDSSLKTTFSSTTAVSAPPGIPAQLRFTTPSTVAITVSSIVKEPVFTSSAIKHVSNIVTSNTLPVSSASSLKTYSKNKNQTKVTPMSVSGQVSPFKIANKFTTSTPIKSNASLKENTNSVNANKIEVNTITSKALSAAIKSTLPASIPSVTVSSVSSPKVNTSARKRMKSSAKSKSDGDSINNLANVPVASSLATKVVNSQLNLAPISSATITPQQANVHKPGSFLFESSGDIYMLEPVENDDAGMLSPPKRLSNSEICKIKIDRAAQTNETTDFSEPKPKLQRKRATSSNDDAAVMLKVKCYQLEMKYLSIQTECKRLKIELTKERLKNAELAGETVTNAEEETPSDISRNNAAEIMKEIEDKFCETKEANIYTMTKTSVLRSLYEDLEEICAENKQLHKELENYRAHDKFYKSLKKKLFDEEF